MSTWNPSDAAGGIALSNGNLTATTSRGVTVGIAVDLSANRLWVWNPITVRWNGAASGSQNPATGTGGYDISYITGAKFPAWSGYNGPGGDVGIANFGASAFLNTLPSGFSSWNTLAGPTTWNPSDASANISLSNGNLTASAVTTTSTGRSVRATTSLTTGKAYFEIQADTIDSSNGWWIAFGNASASLANFFGNDLNSISYQCQGTVYKNAAHLADIDVFNTTIWRSVRGNGARTSGKLYLEVTASAVDSSNGFIFGLANGTFPLFPGLLGSDNNAIGFQKDGSVRLNNAQVITGNSLNGYLVGATPALAVDFGAQKVWFLSTQAGNWNNDAIANQNPATGAGGLSIAVLGATLYPAFCGYSAGGDASVLNVGGSAFVNTVPSGFSAWDGANVSAQARAMVLA